MKNPFKKSSITDTIVAVGVGGAANAVMDYAVASIPTLAAMDEMTVNLIKIGVGAVGGSMLSNKIAKAGFDGLATVGASDLIKSYITPTDTDKKTGGVAFMGTGRVRKMGQRGFARTVKGAGTVPFMG